MTKEELKSLKTLMCIISFLKIISKSFEGPEGDKKKYVAKVLGFSLVIET